MKDIRTRAEPGWELPAGPADAVRAWNERFPDGVEVAVDFGVYCFVDRTAGPAYLREDGQAAVPVRNVQGDPRLADLWPLLPDTLLWMKDQPDTNEGVQHG